MYNLSILFTPVILDVIFNNVVFAVNIYERKNKVNRKIEKYSFLSTSVEGKSKGIRNRRTESRTGQTKNPMPFDFLSE